MGPRSSSSLDRNSLRIGEVFALLYPTARSIVGASPSSGRLTTAQGNRFMAYAGISASPRVDATKDMAIAMLSTP